ncbi:MAG: phytoene dehydrogenase, partial [Proteobacteria bacterium]|nr:phytoene dehydrogenase [Pseudomonadota bacterium]
MTGSYYDVVVMGMELGPLAAGALLARRGFRVLVLGGGAPFDRYSCYGYRFSRRPFLLTAAHSQAIRRVFEE